MTSHVTGQLPQSQSPSLSDINPKPKRPLSGEDQKNISSLPLGQEYFKGIFISIVSLFSHPTSYWPILIGTHTQVASLLCFIISFQVERKRQYFEYKTAVVSMSAACCQYQEK